MWLLWAQLWCGDGRYPATDQRNHPASTLKGRPAGVTARRADDFSPARWCDLTFFSLFSLKNQCTTRQKVCHLTLGRVCLFFFSPSLPFLALLLCSGYGENSRPNTCVALAAPFRRSPEFRLSGLPTRCRVADGQAACGCTPAPCGR